MGLGKLIINHVNIIFEKIFGINLGYLKDFFFFDYFEDFPYIRRPIKFGQSILNSLKLIKKVGIGLELKYRIKFGSFKLNFKNINQINPQKIHYWLEGNFNKFQSYSRLLKMDWERKESNFDDSIIYRAFKLRFNEGKKWEETEFYLQVLNQISTGIIKWDCNNKAEWDEWLKVVDSLYFKIKENREESQLYSNKIAAIIDKDGHYLIISVIHILSIARLLNIFKIPIQILARHKDWIRFKKRIIYIIIKETYQPLTHPDLQGIPSVYKDYRFNIIKENVTTSQGTLLDIGTNFGYFSRKFEDSGFDCYAVEIDPLICIF